jgi:hypothetical protein
VLSALTTFGKNIRDLKLERDPPEVDDLGDGITAPEVIRDIHLLPGFWKVDGYTKMMRYTAVEPVSDLVTVLAEQHTTGPSSSASTRTAATT